MNKQIATKAAAILRRKAKQYGVKEITVRLGESPLNPKNSALYIDGDIHSLYWNHMGLGWTFQDELRKEWDAVGAFVEPWNSSIFDVYKAQ